MGSLQISKEVVVYGLILAVSSVSLLMDFHLFNDPLKLYTGLILAFLGTTVVLFGLLWKREPPFGVKLLAVSYSLLGVVALVLGGWLYTALFLIALVLFAVAWGLWKGKNWGRTATMILMGLELVISFFGVTNDWVVYLPGILQAVFILWYLNRPHVAAYFNAEPFFDINVSRRTLMSALLVSAGVALLLVYIYMNPPTRTVISNRFQGAGWGGGSGRTFSATRGDLLTYYFDAIDGNPAHVYVESADPPFVTIGSSEVGLSGSGSFEVPVTDRWIIWAKSERGFNMNVNVTLNLTQASLKPSILQLILLVACCGVLILFWTLCFGRARP
jgi:hypothetical protein